MGSVQRAFDRGTRRADKTLATLGEELRNARLQLGLSQQDIARAARIDRAVISRVESARLSSLSIRNAFRIAAVLGLDIAIKPYPSGSSIRDVGQAPALQLLIRAIGPPLTARSEVALPDRDGFPDQRAWDLMLYGHGERTGIEFEQRLYDLQAQLRRYSLKRRDDPVDHFLLVVANTRANLRVVNEFSDLLIDLPRHRTATILGLLRAGSHPPTGLILLDAPVRSRTAQM